jgi:outer membrane receptor protein involved in Fe transport
MRYQVTCITIFIFSSFNIVCSQGTIKGKVFDNKTLEPLSGVYIKYGKNQGTVTDSNGSYIIKSDSSDLRITFGFIGYKSITSKVHIGHDETIDLSTGLDTEISAISQIVVSANKTEQKISDLTVSMDILKPVDYLQTHITDAQELINKTPGIEIMDGQASMRGGSGFSYGVGSRVMALIDGLPMLSPDAGNIKWQFLPLENISQVEIIKGASSVLYGSSALNGVINFRTADASNVPGTQFFAETGIYGNPNNKNWKWWSTPRIFSDFSFSHLQKAGKTDIGFGINLRDDNGYRKYNNEKLARISFRLKHHSAKVAGLTYGVNFNAGYTEKTDFVLWKNAESGALIQDTSSVSRLRGTFLAIDPFISLNNQKRFRHDLRIRLQSSANKFPVRSDKNSEAYSYYMEYQGNYRLSDFINITAGLSVDLNKVISNFYGNHNGSDIAEFTQLELKPLERLKIVAGVRVEQNSLDKEKDKIVPVFRTGINWQVAGYTFLRASFGQGYRYPSIAEKYASTTLGSVKIFPNPFVKAESGWNSEIGIKQGISSGNITGQADFSIFFSQNKDMIEYLFSNFPDPVTGIYNFGFQATNVEQSRVYGYEFEYILRRSFGMMNTSLSGGYTYIYPVEFNPVTFKNTGTFLKYRRKHSLKISLNSSYKKLDIGLDFYAKSKILNIDDVFLNLLTRESILPGFYGYWLTHNKGYLLLDGSLGYKLSRILTLSIAVKNITNTEYMGRPGDIQPQRNYSLRLTGNL